MLLIRPFVCSLLYYCFVCMCQIVLLHFNFHYSMNRCFIVRVCVSECTAVSIFVYMSDCVSLVFSYNVVTGPSSRQTI